MTRVMKGLFLFLSMLMTGTALAKAEPAPAGTYRLVGEQDVASGLRIRKDGHFEYFLAAGALDEQAEGRWRAVGGDLILATEPKPVPPIFERTASTKTKEARLSVSVIWRGGRGIAGVDLRVGFDGGATLDGYTQEDGWRLPTAERRPARWIELSVPMHGVRSPRFPIDPKAANAVTFTLVPNDMGVFDFDGVRVERAGEALIVHRDGARLRYEPVEE